jgi:hypothetical protein
MSIELKLIPIGATPLRTLNVNTKEDPAVVGFPIGVQGGVGDGGEAPFFDFAYTSPSAINQITGIQFCNSATAFITVYGLTKIQSEQYLDYLSSLHVKESKMKTTSKQNQHQQWIAKQLILSKQWYPIRAETQLLLEKQYKQQTPTKYNKLWTWAFSELQQYWNFEHGPFHMFVIRCRPFLVACPPEPLTNQTSKNSSSAKQAKKKDSNQNSRSNTSIVSFVGMYYLRIFGVVSVSTSPAK